MDVFKELWAIAVLMFEVFMLFCGVLFCVSYDSRYVLLEPTRVLDRCEADLPRTISCHLAAYPVLDEPDAPTPSGIRR